MVTAAVPGWVQPAMEAKSLALVLTGSLGWGLLAFRGHFSAVLGWSMMLPVAYLLISSFWSINPLPGLLRMNWVFASMGIAFGLSQEKERQGLFQGLAWGTTLHAVLLIGEAITGLTWMGGEGAGGLFFNSNMAATPLLGCIALGLFGEFILGTQSFRKHLPIWLLALFLCMSRLQIGLGCALILIWALMSGPRGRLSQNLPWIGITLGSIWWIFRIHSWAWMLGGPISLGVWWARKERKAVILQPFLAVGICLSMVLGAAGTYRPGSQAASKVSRTANSDNNWLVRKHYYRIALQGWAESPLWGLGLGSARGEAPRFVDKTLPSKMSGFGDFIRPNNLHSDWLEITMEGGILLWIFWLIGLWMDRKYSKSTFKKVALIISALLIAGVFDFPLHKPFAIVFVVVLLLPSDGATRILSPWEKGASWASAFALALVGLGAAYASHLRPKVEMGFRSRLSPEDSLKGSQLIERLSAFDPDLTDLAAKSLVQWGASPLGQADGRRQARLLDAALKKDPWDHHLILRRMQLAKQLGESEIGRAMAEKYSIAAPADPDRFLRLARDSAANGNSKAAELLVVQAQRQPGWEPRHASVARAIIEEAQKRE